MSNNKKNSASKIAADSSPAPTSLKVVANAGEVNPNQTKPSKSTKVHYCKELDCSQTAQLKGMCRLHYLKAIAAKNQAANRKGGDDEGEEKAAERWDRRRSNRMGAFENMNESENSQSRDARIEHLGALDADLTTFLDTEDLDPFKKTG